MHRRDRIVFLAALILLALLVALDHGVARRHPQGSQALSVLELRSGGNAITREKVLVRRDHFEQVVSRVADPDNPLGLTPSERADALGRVRNLEGLLRQALWTASRLSASLTPEERARIEGLRRNRFVINSAARSGPRSLEEQLAEAYGLSPPPAPARPPAGWNPETERGLGARWMELRRGGTDFVADGLLDFDAPVFLLAVALDQKEHPVRGDLARSRYALGRGLLQAAADLDQLWRDLFERILQGGSGRGGLLPEPPTDGPARGGDLDLPELLRRLRELSPELEQRL